MQVQIYRIRWPAAYIQSEYDISSTVSCCRHFVGQMRFGIRMPARRCEWNCILQSYTYAVSDFFPFFIYFVTLSSLRTWRRVFLLFQWHYNHPYPQLNVQNHSLYAS